MISLEINQTYSTNTLVRAGYTCFPARVQTAVVFIKEGSVYFFSRESEFEDEVTFIHASTL